MWLLLIKYSLYDFYNLMFNSSMFMWLHTHLDDLHVVMLSDIHHSSALTTPAERQHQHTTSPSHNIIQPLLVRLCFYRQYNSTSTRTFMFYRPINFYIILNLILFIAINPDVYTAK